MRPKVQAEESMEELIPLGSQEGACRAVRAVPRSGDTEAMEDGDGVVGGFQGLSLVVWSLFCGREEEFEIGVQSREPLEEVGSV